jgi:hypothetical protein
LASSIIGSYWKNEQWVGTCGKSGSVGHESNGWEIAKIAMIAKIVISEG